ncbi:MAG: ATP-binding cassette domain-containing protein [Pseudomonadales bacterium]|nr:ATP-binding cassette domain-containing protein [Pseudomonadales bacterium]
MASIELIDVSFSYPSAGPDVRVIDNLSLAIEDGERHAILGASGAGKTTLLNLLSGILQPDQGQILFDGETVQGVSTGDRSLTQVFQFPVLYESLSVHDNLIFALKNRGEFDADAALRVNEIVSELGLEGSLESKPGQLDLYQKQLVAVAKVIVRSNTRLVLLDEPLTAVDPTRKWQMRRILRRIQARFGLTMVYVTHDQTEAMSFAEKISVLTVDGIAQTGTPDELYEKPETPFVGHFVGSPGMNFLPATTLAGEEIDRESGAVIGFRQDWASIRSASDEAADVTGVVRDVRLTHTEAGQEVGLIYIETKDNEIVVAGGGHDIGVEVRVRIHKVARYVAGRLEAIDDR